MEDNEIQAVQQALTMIHQDIESDVKDMKDRKPNKSSEKKISRYEDKLENLIQWKLGLKNKLTEYIEKYEHEIHFEKLTVKFINLDQQYSTVIQNLYKLRQVGNPEITFIETPYSQHKDLKAAKVNVTEFLSENFLYTFIKWIETAYEEKGVPVHLINNQMKYALPHSVHTRLVEQHPENSRTVSDEINFLLKHSTD